MPYNINFLPRMFDYYKQTSESGAISQVTEDPASPAAEEAWVLRSGTGGGIADGTPMGLLLGLTYTDNGGIPFTYQFSYRTKEGTTKRVSLT